jgi:hypothetical protein
MRNEKFVHKVTIGLPLRHWRPEELPDFLTDWLAFFYYYFFNSLNKGETESTWPLFGLLYQLWTIDYD